MNRMRMLTTAVALSLSLALGGSGSAMAQPLHDRVFNQPGNILIADQFNNRVVEMDDDANIVWYFGSGSSVPGPGSIVAPNDVERVFYIGPTSMAAGYADTENPNDLTLISGTGAPPGSEPGCDNGCPDNRVILVTKDSRIVWQYGGAGVTGSGPNQLDTPVCAVYLPLHRHVLITDQGNQRVIEVNREDNAIVWQYGTTGVAGADANELNDPNSAELLSNGNVLIADEGNNRVIEVNADNEIVWQYGDPADPTILNGAAFASRLSSGNTLITDSGNNRVLEVAEDGTVVWQYATNAEDGSIEAPLPTRAVRLRNGDTLISNQFNDQVIEVDPTGVVVMSLGQIGVPGSGFDQLNAPYDAKAIDDYTGLTPPIWPVWY